MTNEQIRRRWKRGTTRTWDELQQQYHLPIPVPLPDRREVEEDFLGELDGACEAEVDELLVSHREAAERVVRRVASYLVALALRGGVAATAGSPPAGAARRFAGDRYLRVLALVSQRYVSYADLLQRRLDTRGWRIPWTSLVKEWNKAYPDDPLTAATLRRYYYGARHDEDLCRRYFDDLLDRWAKTAGPLVEMLVAAGCREEDLIVRSVTRTATTPPDMTGVPPDLAEGIRRMWESKESVRAEPRLSPEVARVYKLAADRDCALMAKHIRFPPDTRLCRGPRCRRCKLGAALVCFGFVERGQLSASAARAAVKEWEAKAQQEAEDKRHRDEWLKAYLKRSRPDASGSDGAAKPPG
jgi:hypothetical protein